MKITQITENMSHTAKRIHDIEKEKGVKPGTPEWFKLWFSLPYLKESITEAFDNPYPYTWDASHDRYAEFGNDSFLAKAEMDMGELMVMFTLGKPGVSWTIDFAVDGSMDKTGDGDQFRIFATVVAVIKDWMANKVDLSKVTQIDFSSDKDGAAEDSRSKLYKRFGQQLASKLGWNLEVTDRGQFASFKIKNPDAPVEEAVNNENFADGKVKGKSRPGRVKKSGASCNGSVTELRAKAKKASGEKAKMYHWCANMKAGKKK